MFSDCWNRSRNLRRAKERKGILLSENHFYDSFMG
jgi:hypothetical protein